MDFLAKVMAGKRVGAAIRRVDDLNEALRHQNISTIFLLGGDINYLPLYIKNAEAANKLLITHIDLMEGIGKDRAGIHLLKRMGLKGVVTTKSNLAKNAKDEGLLVIQRLFIVDSESIKTAIRVADNIKPDAVEFLPATIPEYVIRDMKRSLKLPILGGGLLKTKEDVYEALDKGIDAITTSLRYLWDIK